MKYLTIMKIDEKAYETLRNAISILGEMDSQLFDITTKKNGESMTLFKNHCVNAFDSLYEFIEYYDKHYKDAECS